jgi:hypothetical protein
MWRETSYKMLMSLRTGKQAHARKMKAISLGTYFIGKVLVRDGKIVVGGTDLTKNITCPVFI